MANAKARLPRIKRLLGLRRGRAAAAKVAFTGLMPSIMYGVNCTGMTDSELKHTRALVVKAIEPRPQGKSTTGCLMFGGPREIDPMFGATLAPVCALARALWEGWLPSAVLRNTFDGFAKHVRSWRDVRGPISAAALSLRRVGYDVRGFDQWIRRGTSEIINITDSSPWYVKQVLRKDVQAWQLRQLANDTHEGITHGAFLPQVRRWLNVGKASTFECRKWTPLDDKQRGYVRSLLVHGQWLNQRRYEAAPRLAPAPCCELHPSSLGTLWHRHLECSDSWPSYELPEELVKFKQFESSVTIRTLFERLLVPEPSHDWRPPQDDLLQGLRWLKGDSDPFINTELFADGCCYEAGTSLAMAGSGVIELPPGPEGADPGKGSCVKALGAPVPGPIQSIDGAELLSLYAILRHSLPPITAHFDADYVVKGLLERGRAETTSYKSAWGEVWRRIWHALDDFGDLSSEGLTVLKVKGHATFKDVDEGKISLRRRRGNFEADRVAKFVTDHFRAPEEAREARKTRSLTLDGAIFWVAQAGAEAADLRIDFRDKYREVTSKGPKLLSLIHI